MLWLLPKPSIWRPLCWLAGAVTLTLVAVWLWTAQRDDARLLASRVRIATLGPVFTQLDTCLLATAPWSERPFIWRLHGDRVRRSTREPTPAHALVCFDAFSHALAAALDDDTTRWPDEVVALTEATTRPDAWNLFGAVHELPAVAALCAARNEARARLLAAAFAADVALSLPPVSCRVPLVETVETDEDALTAQLDLPRTWRAPRLRRHHGRLCLDDSGTLRRRAIHCFDPVERRWHRLAPPMPTAGPWTWPDQVAHVVAEPDDEASGFRVARLDGATVHLSSSPLAGLPMALDRPPHSPVLWTASWREASHDIALERWHDGDVIDTYEIASHTKRWRDVWLESRVGGAQLFQIERPPYGDPGPHTLWLYDVNARGYLRRTSFDLGSTLVDTCAEHVVTHDEVLLVGRNETPGWHRVQLPDDFRPQDVACAGLEVLVVGWRNGALSLAHCTPRGCVANDVLTGVPGTTEVALYRHDAGYRLALAGVLLMGGERLDDAAAPIAALRGAATTRHRWIEDTLVTFSPPPIAWE